METTEGFAQNRATAPARARVAVEGFMTAIATLLVLAAAGCEVGLPGGDPAAPGAADGTGGVVVSALITGWSDADIGTTGKAGSATLSGTTYTVLGAGADIYGTADGFHFAWQTLAGDGTVVARVATQQNTNAQAKAGVMIRESTASGARNAFMALTPTGGAPFQRRTSTGGTTSNTTKAAIAAPYWVRLVRAGNVFTGSISADGATWTTVGSATVSMATSALAGLAVSSHKSGTLSTATFTNVAVTPKPVNQPPSASFTATPTSGTAPLAVAFDARASTDPDGTIASWAWVFGDGSTGTGSTASHTYGAGGTFTATLTVTDNLGATATKTAAVTVTNPALPAPWTDADIGTVGATGSAFLVSGTLTVVGSGADIWDVADAFHYAWQPMTGDGTIVARVATQQNTNSWAKAGVMIRASTAAGSAHAFVALTPTNGAAFQRRSSTGGASTNVSVGTYKAPYWVRLVRAGNTFTGSISPDGTTWTTVGSATFTMASSALVGLAVSSHSAGVLSTATFTDLSVTTTTPPANQLPTAAFTATPTTGAAPLAVAFDGSTSSDPDGTIASWAWAFGDGATGTGKTASHTYTVAGTWTATLTVTDNSGGTATKQATLTVNPAGNQPPVAVLTATPQAGKAPLAVTFDASGSTDPDGTVVAWHLDFGDGTSFDGVTAAHT